MIWMSRIAMKAPRMALRMAIQSRRVGGGIWPGAKGSVTQVNPDLDRHARPDDLTQRVIAVDHYLDRNALYHLGEVAGGIVRRQQAELGTGGREQAVDVALYRLIVEGVEDQGGALALVHALDLGFLEIGLDPQVPVRYQGQQMRAGLHVLPRADAALSDPTCHRGANLGAGEVDLGGGDVAFQIGRAHV